MFGLVTNLYLYTYLKAKKKASYANQIRDVEQTKDLIYIDRQFVLDMNLSEDELIEMAMQPEKYALSNHLKRKLNLTRH